MSNLGNRKVMAKNIQYYMNLHGKTRKDMCEALGVKYTTFTDWVKGNAYPRIDKIELMANYFGISKADLVEDKSEAPEIPQIFQYYNKLNNFGKREATKRVEELTYIPQYSADSVLPNAANERANATAEEKAISDNIMMDDSEWE